MYREDKESLYYESTEQDKPPTDHEPHVPLHGLHEGIRETGADNSRARLQLTSLPSPPSPPCTRRRWPSCSRWSCCCSSQQSRGPASCPPPSCRAHVSVHDASFGRTRYSGLHSRHLRRSQACLTAASHASNPCSILQKNSITVEWHRQICPDTNVQFHLPAHPPTLSPPAAPPRATSNPCSPWHKQPEQPGPAPATADRRTYLTVHGISRPGEPSAAPPSVYIPGPASRQDWLY